MSETCGVKASELIAAIQKQIAVHGDIQICVPVDGQLRPVAKVFGSIEELGPNWRSHDQSDNILVIQPLTRS